MFHFLTATADPAATGGLAGTFFVLIGMFALMYFIMIRPENKRKKEAEAMRSAVKKGDKITTIGGIVGVVVDVKEEKTEKKTKKTKTAAKAEEKVETAEKAPAKKTRKKKADETSEA